jgi:catechol 2,3-dioxygenase-like lactoylglutathione lyase family enzyme/carbon monoxide dehydrogenase subunit G
MDAAAPPLNQIAFSVLDLRLTERWFREGCGLAPAGGSRRMMRGAIAARVQGLPGAASTCWWLVGRNPWLQLEFFQFERPIARLMPRDFRPCDTGYTRIGLWVEDFDATLGRLAGLGTTPLTAPLGELGARRACVRSPDGVFVELMESDPISSRAGPGRDACGTAVRSVTLSVPDLDQTVAFFGGALGLAKSGTQLHEPGHESLWGLAGARTRSAVFTAGDVLIEAVQYLGPRGRPWPDGYRISDQGILNIAFGARSRRDHVEILKRAVAGGARPNCRPFQLPGAGVVYVNDPQGFSVELLWMKSGMQDRRWGFEPLPIDDRPPPDTHSITRSVRVAASADRAWKVLMDHEGMSSWSGFKRVTLERPGETDRNGRGAVRSLWSPLGTVMEQVTCAEAPRLVRYRVIAGSPFVCHQGEIRLEPEGAGTRICWTVRFRPRIPGTGGLLSVVFGRMLGSAMRDGLTRQIEKA